MKVNGEQVLVNRNTGVIVEHYGDAIPKNRSVIPLRPFAQFLVLPDLHQYGVSTSAISATHARYGKRLAEMGINPSLMSDVKIEYGHPDKLRANRDGSITVQVSRKSENKRHPVNKTQLWKNYRQALAHSYMDAIERGHTRLYEDMRVAFDHHYRESQRLALQAISLNQSPMTRVALSLQIKLWHRLPSWTKKHATPEELGQINLDRQNGWRDEATQILAEVQKSGWDGMDKRMRDNRAKLKSRITKRKNMIADASMLGKLSLRLSGKRRKLLREILESETKLQAMAELQHRLDFLKRHLPH